MSETTPVADDAGATQAQIPPTIDCTKSSVNSLVLRVRNAGAALAVPIRFIVRRPGRAIAMLLLIGVFVLGAGVAGSFFWAGYQLRQARIAIDRFHYEEAPEHLEFCLKIWPNDAETLLLSARAARRLGAYESAENFLDRLQNVRGKDSDDLILEQVLLRAERGETDDVRTFCRTLVDENHPATALVLEAMASGYIRLFRMRDAEDCLKRWLEAEPDNPQAHYLLGTVYERKNRSQDAVSQFRRALEIDAEFDPAREHLAGMLIQLSQAKEAVPHLEYLRHRHPDSITVQIFLAQSFDQVGNQVEAERVLNSILERHPDSGIALMERGKLAMRAGKLGEAEGFLKKAAAREPGDYQVQYLYNQCLVQQGKTDEARASQARLKDLENDLINFEQLVGTRMQQNPRNPALHYEAGMIALRSGAIPDGLRWLNSALKLDPKHVPAHKALAYCYQRLGNPARAAYHREQAAAADAERPNDKKVDVETALPSFDK